MIFFLAQLSERLLEIALWFVMKNCPCLYTQCKAVLFCTATATIFGCNTDCQVQVLNSLPPPEALSVHWHGIEQVGCTCNILIQQICFDSRLFPLSRKAARIVPLTEWLAGTGAHPADGRLDAPAGHALERRGGGGDKLRHRRGQGADVPFRRADGRHLLVTAEPTAAPHHPAPSPPASRQSLSWCGAALSPRARSAPR